MDAAIGWGVYEKGLAKPQRPVIPIMLPGSLKHYLMCGVLSLCKQGLLLAL